MSAIGPVALALVAGVGSFTSPCCLSLMPGYVAYVSGVAAEAGGTVLARPRVLGAALLFVLGFATVFTLLGAGVSVAGAVLLRNRLVIEKVAGAFVIPMGLVTMGLLRVPFLYRDARLDLRRIRTGPLGAVPLGMAFAIGWTPCIGPVLAGILTAAATLAWTGAGLLFVYSSVWPPPSSSWRGDRPGRSGRSDGSAATGGPSNASGVPCSCSWEG